MSSKRSACHNGVRAAAYGAFAACLGASVSGGGAWAQTAVLDGTVTPGNTGLFVSNANGSISTSTTSANFTAIDTKMQNKAVLAPFALTLSKTDGPGGTTSKETNVIPGQINIEDKTVATTNTAGGFTIINGGNASILGGTDTNVGGTADTLRSANSALEVTGGVSIRNGLVVLNGANISGGAAIDTLTVSGAAKLKGGAVVTGNTTTDTLTVNQNATVGGALNVAGKTTVGAFSVTPASTVDFGGNAVGGVGAPLLGTDAANKAYVDQGIGILGTQVNRRLDKVTEGVAIALSLEQPILLPGQTFAVRGGFGNFDGYNALGLSAAGVVSKNAFGFGSTATLDGGVGFGTDKGGVAGKAGITLGW